MLGAARDVEHGVADHGGENAADQGASVASRMDVTVVEHGVAPAADLARGGGLSLGQNGDGFATDGGQNAARGVGVDGVLHDVVAD